MARLDPHSHADSAQPLVQHLDWHARVDFSQQRLIARATLTLAEPGRGPLDLDTRDLDVQAVDTPDGTPVPFELGPAEPILGARLRIALPPETAAVRIRYRTAPDASALQWLDGPQTLGGVHPFLFSQCQAIHARSVVPLQDTPTARIRFQAELTIPRALRAVMAAAPLGRQEHGEQATESFAMPQPIPPYLFAFAVGDLAARDLGPRSRVWAEPGIVEQAAWEFATVDQMLAAGESLFGPYDWDRFDILLMPPSFPYGGMENPRLTFITPTVVAGDRSLVGVIAHELAHSWTGNLVTNANAEHFWLNEGFTTYAERRIVEVLDGADMAALDAALGWRALEEAIGVLRDHPEWTKLRLNLEGIDPDEAFSSVPYEKGYLFLVAIEQVVGRERFDAFLRAYLQRFRFGTLTTEDFMRFMEQELPHVLGQVDASTWLHEPGIPPAAPRPRSGRLEVIERLVATSALPSDEIASAWTATEWQIYLESLPRDTPLDHLSQLDRRFALTDRQNFDVLVSWLILAAHAGYRPSLPRTEQVLGQVGRLKYLKPLYRALAHDPETAPFAREWFQRYQPRYHLIARQVVQTVGPGTDLIHPPAGT